MWDFRVPETDLTVTLNDAFWQGAPISFRGPGRDRGTVQRVAKPLRLEEGESLCLLAPLEVQRVSGAGGLYLVALKESGTEDGTENDLEKETQGSAFLGRNVALLGLDHSKNVITATVADARLGRPPSATMQPGRTYRFRLQEGKLLELD